MSSHLALATLPPGHDPGPTAADPYELEGRLGEGGMGVVHVARHRASGRRVALKVLREGFAHNKKLHARLLREAHGMARIDSPHVVGVLELGRLSDGRAFIAMELLEGRDLAAELARTGTLPVARGLSLVRQICEALIAAHDAGVIHRDLKAENVFLMADGGAPDFVKVLDFGLAKVRGLEAITIAGTTLGTPLSMSPEQCAGEAVDARADIYSVGVILYRVLAGRYPFESSAVHELLYAHLTETPSPPSAHRSGLSTALDAVVLRCLAKSPADRFQSMGELAAALDALRAPAERFGGPRTQPEPRPSARRARRRIAASALVAGAGLALLAALGGWALARSHRTEDRVVVTEQVGASEAQVEVPERVEEPAPVQVEAAPVPPAAAAPEVAIRETFLFVTDPPGASVYIGDERLGRTPLEITRPQDGERLTLRVRLSGHREREVAITRAVGEHVRIGLEPRPERPEIPPARVLSIPPAPSRSR